MNRENEQRAENLRRFARNAAALHVGGEKKAEILRATTAYVVYLRDVDRENERRENKALIAREAGQRSYALPTAPHPAVLHRLERDILLSVRKDGVPPDRLEEAFDRASASPQDTLRRQELKGLLDPLRVVFLATSTQWSTEKGAEMEINGQMTLPLKRSPQRIKPILRQIPPATCRYRPG